MNSQPLPVCPDVDPRVWTTPWPPDRVRGQRAPWDDGDGWADWLPAADRVKWRAGQLIAQPLPPKPAMPHQRGAAGRAARRDVRRAYRRRKVAVLDVTALHPRVAGVVEEARDAVEQVRYAPTLAAGWLGDGPWVWYRLRTELWQIVTLAAAWSAQVDAAARLPIRNFDVDQLSEATLASIGRRVDRLLGYAHQVDSLDVLYERTCSRDAAEPVAAAALDTLATAEAAEAADVAELAEELHARWQVEQQLLPAGELGAACTAEQAPESTV